LNPPEVHVLSPRITQQFFSSLHSFPTYTETPFLPPLRASFSTNVLLPVAKKFHSFAFFVGRFFCGCRVWGSLLLSFPGFVLRNRNNVCSPGGNQAGDFLLFFFPKIRLQVPGPLISPLTQRARVVLTAQSTFGVLFCLPLHIPLHTFPV